MPLIPVVVAVHSPFNMNKNTNISREQTYWLDFDQQFTLVKITGKDRVTFLQRLTSNDVEKLPIGSGQRNAILNKRSCILNDFFVYKTPGALLLLTETTHCASLLLLLDKYLFAESAKIEDLSHSIRLLSVQGEDAWRIATQVIKKNSSGKELLGHKVVEKPGEGDIQWLFSHSFTGDPGYILAANSSNFDSFKNQLKVLPISMVQWEDLETFRIESGYLEKGKDFDLDTLIQMLNMGDKILSTTKGCFPGQELIARVISRGEIKQKIMGLEFQDSVDDPIKLEPHDMLLVQGGYAGRVKRAVFSQTFSKTIAIAHLEKNAVIHNKVFDFEVGGRTIKAKVIKLPFYVSSHITQPARHAYDEGMVFYHHSQYAEALEKFDQSLSIYPEFIDAHEAKAMTFENMGLLDEAIAFNKAFARKDPDAIMAHANLSRLYMLKGWKDKAEDELGKSTMLRFKQAAAEKGEDEVTAMKQQEEAQQAEQQRKLNIFRQVLDMDPQDETANFGYGKIQLEHGEYKEAETALKIVIDNNPRYSAAYEALVQSLTAQQKLDEARQLARTGIEIAEQQGNLMPANNMRRLLAQMK
jgi:folate-binding protein YgfZ